MATTLMATIYDKYKIIQTSPHGTGSTLLVNILTGLFYDKEPIHWISVSKPYSVKLKHFITKIHKTDIDQWLANQPDSDKLFFVMSEREKRIDDKYRTYDNVLIVSYDELLETKTNSIEQIVDCVHEKLIGILTKELIDEMNKPRAVQRVKDMNAFYATIKNKPFNYLDEYYHLHGSHRGRRRK